MNDIITIHAAPGHRFRVYVEQDDINEAPWQSEDGHGPVRFDYAYYGRPSKRPGERILHSDRGSYWFYDWQAACKMARKDGWNAEPFDAPGRIERAVQADFGRLRRWLSGDWFYVGVCVALLNESGDDATNKYSHALWGIESDCEEYIAEVAQELALECAKSEGITIEQRREAWRGALKEARERQHWAQRDVATA